MKDTHTIIRRHREANKVGSFGDLQNSLGKENRIDFMGGLGTGGDEYNGNQAGAGRKERILVHDWK